MPQQHPRGIFGVCRRIGRACQIGRYAHLARAVSQQCRRTLIGHEHIGRTKGCAIAATRRHDARNADFQTLRLIERGIRTQPRQLGGVGGASKRTQRGKLLGAPRLRAVCSCAARRPRSPAACASSCRASRSIAANAGLSPRKRAHRSDHRAVRSARISANRLNAAFFVIPENGESAQSARSARSQRPHRSRRYPHTPGYGDTARPPLVKETAKRADGPAERGVHEATLPAQRHRTTLRTSAGATRPNSAAGSFAATMSKWLTEKSGVPVDFKFQPRTFANERHKKPRNPIGLFVSTQREED